MSGGASTGVGSDFADGDSVGVGEIFAGGASSASSSSSADGVVELAGTVFPAAGVCWSARLLLSPARVELIVNTARSVPIIRELKIRFSIAPLFFGMLPSRVLSLVLQFSSLGPKTASLAMQRYRRLEGVSNKLYNIKCSLSGATTQESCICSVLAFVIALSVSIRSWRSVIRG